MKTSRASVYTVDVAHNHRLNPTVGTVTGLAGAAGLAPVPPAG